MKQFKHIKLFGTAVIAVILSLGFASCGNDEPNGSDENNNIDSTPYNYNEYKDIFDALMNTSWRLVSSKEYYNSGVKDLMLVDDDEKYLLNSIITFSSVMNENGIHSNGDLEFKISTLPGVGRWGIYDNGHIWYRSAYHFESDSGIRGYTEGAFLRILGFSGEIVVLTSTRLQIRDVYDSFYTERIFSKVTGNDPNNGDNGSGGNSDHHYPCKSCGETGKCWNCNGSGVDPITKQKCNTCHGNGKCQICNGKGYIIV